MALIGARLSPDRFVGEAGILHHVAVAAGIDLPYLDSKKKSTVSDALYALQEAGGLTTARKQGGVGPVDLLAVGGCWGAKHQVLS